MKKVLTLAVVLAVGALAPADPIVDVVVDNNGAPPGVVGFTMYDVYLVTQPGYFANGLDGRFDGPMRQVWKHIGMLFTTPNLMYMALLGAEAPADSHVMVVPGGPAGDPTTGTEAPGFEVVEDNVHDGSYVGLGSYLAGAVHPDDNPTGIFAVAWTGILTENLHVAHLVVPDGEVVCLTGNASYKWQTGVDPDTGEIIYTYRQNPVDICIPEPTALGLLAVGGIAALLRRRRG